MMHLLRHNPSRARLLKALLCLLLWALSAPQAGAETPARAPEEALRRFERLWVQSPQGRPEPLETYASEVLRKIAHRDHYKTFNATEVLLGWLADPATWARQPLVYLADKTLRERFTAPEERRAAFDAFFDERGGYLPAKEIELAYSRPPAQRTRSEKELIKLDEKINLLKALSEGQMLPAIPALTTWHSPGDPPPEHPEDTPAPALSAVPFFTLFEAVRKGDRAACDQALSAIETLQAEWATRLQLDQRRKEAELFANRADLFRIAMRGYLILGFLFLGALFLPAGPARRGMLIALAAGIGLLLLGQSAGMALRGYISGRAPWTNAYETMVYVAWTTVLAGGIFARRSPVVLGLGTLMGGVILFVSNLHWLDPQITPLVPVLRSPWLMIHVSVITASYGFFGIGALCGLGTLAGMALGRRNPALPLVSEAAMTIGLALLVAGILFGAVWANESWGRYWGWDPKETWALITMLYYAVALHARFIRKLDNAYVLSLFAVGGIYVVGMTFFGVNYLLSGLHAYGHSGGISLWPLGIFTVLLTALAVLAAWEERRQLSGISNKKSS